MRQKSDAQKENFFSLFFLYSLFFVFPGGSQDERGRDGAQDEQAPLTQKLHAQGTTAHEEIAASKYTQVRV